MAGTAPGTAHPAVCWNGAENGIKAAPACSCLPTGYHRESGGTKATPWVVPACAGSAGKPRAIQIQQDTPSPGLEGVLPQAEPMAAAHPTHPPRAWGRNFKVFYVISLKPEYKMQKLMLCSKHQERSLSQPGAKLQCGLSLAEAEVKPGLCCQILGGEDGSEVMAA